MLVVHVGEVFFVARRGQELTAALILRKRADVKGGSEISMPYLSYQQINSSKGLDRKSNSLKVSTLRFIIT